MPKKIQEINLSYLLLQSYKKSVIYNSVNHLFLA